MTDRPEDGLSSEELIERARRGFDTTPPPTDDAIQDVATTPGPAPTPEYTPPPEYTTPEYTPTPEPAAADDTSPEPRRGNVAEPRESMLTPDRTPSTSDDGSLLPEHFQPDAGAATAQQPSMWSKLASRWGWIAAGVVGFFLISSFFNSDTAVDDLQVGDCYVEPGNGEISTVETVDCAEEHDYEVFALVNLLGTGGSYPGDDALFEEGSEVCFERFFDYLDADFGNLDVPFDYAVYIPAESAWDAGNREAMCALYAINDSFFQIPATGSARNSG